MATPTPGGPLTPDLWRRIGAVLDRVSSVEPHARAEAVAEACQAEELSPAVVEPFLDAERMESSRPDQVDAALAAAALQELAGGVPPAREPGDRLGPYEIIGPLGAGGMGEVYRARDTRLGRTVALKLLHADLAARPDGRVRFEREARAISALNHPHICTLHDVSIGEAGQAAPSYLVMELVDGETLASRLARGPAKIEEALEWGAQIAEALAAAHRLGIVHRDLKPGNVMVTRHGVKVLDFGLAALMPVVSARPGVTEQALTAEGTILGTVQYMAPEQLQGRAADERADVFAFGAILYEMLTGRRAFEADDTATAIAAVVDREPPKLSERRAGVPPAVEWAVNRCLAKTPDQRWQDIADLGALLRRVMASPDDPLALSTRRRRPSRAVIGAMAMVGLALAVAAGALLTRLNRAAPAREILRYEIPPPEGTSYQRMFAFSPDGRQIAFTATDGNRRAIWIRPLDALASRRLDGTDGAFYPFWSPDAQFIGFFADNKLKKIELATGRVQIICDAGLGGGGAWNAEGTILFSPQSTTGPALLYRVSASGGTPIPVTSRVSGYSVHGWPHFLPDGRHYLYRRTDIGGASGVFVGSLDSADSRPLLTIDTPMMNVGQLGLFEQLVSRATYASGHLFYVRARTLYAQPFDPETRTLTGDPIRVADDVFQDSPGRTAMDVSSAGVLAYRARTEGGRSQLTWVDRTGREVGRVGEPDNWAGPSISPDGRSVLVAELAVPSKIVRIDVDRGIASPVTNRGIVPVWSPDGARVVFRGSAGGGPLVSIAPADGSQPNGELLGLSLNAWPGHWSRAGNFIVGTTIRAETSSWDVFVKAVGAPGGAAFPVASGLDEGDPRLSPDERWLAYAQRNAASGWAVYVRPFNREGGAIRVSPRSGRHPRWSANGRELFFVDSDGTILSAPVRAGEKFEVLSVVPLLRHPALLVDYDAGFHTPYDVAPDGTRFLIDVPTATAKPTPLTVIVNWPAALSR